MKKIILVPDSFKGTMSSFYICSVMKKACLDIFPEAQVISLPVADGGEGTVDAFLEAVGGIKKEVKVENPFFEKIKTYYGILANEKDTEHKTAVIETALCAGLPLAEGRLNPSITTTYGVGTIIKDALANGCTKIILGLGGSATNDGGCGLLSALGLKFFNFENQEFIPTGGTLKNIARIDVSNLNPALKHCSITVMCDIDNPLYGETGAAYVFAPQKGADPNCVRELDEGLRHFAQAAKAATGKDCAFAKGTGAAGGMGYGALVFLAANLQMGIETVLDTVHFDKALSDADFVFTGEGKLDSQSVRGKVIAGVGRRARQKSVPVIAVVGDAAATEAEMYAAGLSAVFSINRLAVPYSEAKKTASADLAYTMHNILRLLKLNRTR